MEIVKNEIGDAVIISLKGKLTADSTSAFDEFVDAFVEKSKFFIFDLSETEYIDSTGLGALVHTLQLVADRGGKMILASIQPKPKLVFNITRTYKLFNIHETLESALEAIHD